jgi:hypothetical protein
MPPYPSTNSKNNSSDLHPLLSIPYLVYWLYFRLFLHFLINLFPYNKRREEMNFTSIVVKRASCGLISHKLPPLPNNWPNPAAKITTHSLNTKSHSFLMQKQIHILESFVLLALLMFPILFYRVRIPPYLLHCKCLCGSLFVNSKNSDVGYLL